MFKKEKKWKLCLYYQNQLIKIIKVDEKFEPINANYTLRVWFKKHLFGANLVQIVFRFKALKYTDNEKRETHIELKIWEGVS